MMLNFYLEDLLFLNWGKELVVVLHAGWHRS